MGQFFVNRFKSGKWLDKGNSILGNKSKLMSLVSLLPKYMRKGGLQKCKDDLSLLGGYISDIVRGRYHDYSQTSLTLAIAALVYVVSPLDVLPDFVPAGFLDDVTIVTWAMAQLAGELSQYRAFRESAENKDETGGTDESDPPSTTE